LNQRLLWEAIVVGIKLFIMGNMGNMVVKEVKGEDE
jgi:hypothetical protein